MDTPEDIEMQGTFNNHTLATTSVVSLPHALGLESNGMTTAERPTTFHFFSKLPSSVRRRIWRHTWEPREVVPTDFVQEGCFIRGAPYDYHEHMPASGYVNQESRQETILHYELSFRSPLNRAGVWFNFSLDTLFMPLHHRPWVHYDHDDLERLQRLSMPEWLPVGWYDATKRPLQWPSLPTRICRQEAFKVKTGSSKALLENPELYGARKLLTIRCPNLKELHLRLNPPRLRSLQIWRQHHIID
ncbi:Uu.00g085330.m01.CDS01 [Anthostomella pinea]|uniref:Uu.00g085330.m01.CDS01 n=1 Tax=Anthostomella pinea TaxID=933095 RepID=A0AAI8VMK8_9PEZI|nr:Uu.00g085330.m01.CDS01 [Anthostomella pinea]